jgi:hypothetical protein
MEETIQRLKEATCAVEIADILFEAKNAVTKEEYQQLFREAMRQISRLTTL